MSAAGRQEDRTRGEAGRKNGRARRAPDLEEGALRRDARDCLLAGIAAADARALTRETLGRLGDPFPGERRILVAGFGKAALGMGAGARDVLGERIAAGALLVPHGYGVSVPATSPARAPSGAAPGARLGPLPVLTGGHPLPDAAGVAGAREIASLARRAAETRVPLLCLISGGGSALLTLPAEGIPLPDLRQLTHLLLACGADIARLNHVRKHLDSLKGGRLARLAAPAPVLGLVLSDVIGDPLDTIAAGPLSPDPGTFADAIAVLRDFGVWAAAPDSVRRRLADGEAGRIEETPAPGDPAFAGVRTLIVGNAATAASAVARAAEARGYVARVTTLALAGEAREAGADLARRAITLRSQAPAPREGGRRALVRTPDGDALVGAQDGHPLLRPPGGLALVSAGETTVTVRGRGLGGRNQEFVLAAAVALEGHPGIAIASLGTDGIDGPTDAAGAMATSTSASRARSLGLDPAALLAENDSHRFFEALGDHLETGPTGTNVMDLQIALISPRDSR